MAHKKHQPGCPCCDVALCNVLFDGVYSCGTGLCLVAGAEVGITQASLGFATSGLTNSSGDITLQVPCNTSVTYSYTIRKGDSLVKSGTFVLDSGPPIGKTLSATGAAVEIPTASGHWCHRQGGTLFCGGPIPAAVNVTIPNRSDTFGSLAGTTVSVPFLSASGGLVTFRGCFDAVGGCFGGTKRTSIEVGWTDARLCGSPTAGVRIWLNPSPPSCPGYPGTGAYYLANAISGSMACPVAFTTTNGHYDASGGFVACGTASWSGTECAVSE